MKKFFSFIAFVALSAVMLCSCSDSNCDVDPVPSPEPEAEGPDYLVMMYAVGGGNLDHCIVANIMQALDEGGNDKVKMTFQYKLSEELQKVPELESFDGTRRFTADDNAHIKGKFETLTSNYPRIPEWSKEPVGDLDRSTTQLKTERFADAKYDMASSEALTDFIKWSNGKYPNAKRKVLIISDHGHGWSFFEDGQKDTRSILQDDNLDKILSLNDVVNGINNGGGVDLLYTDACLMSTYENLYGYSQCTKYLVASFEVAPGIGGDYRELMKVLKNAGTQDADLEGAMKKFVDYTVSDSWWKNYIPDDCHDIALFDLSKLSTVTPILKNVASMLTEKYASTESIEPTKETLHDDKFAPFIRLAAQSCIVSDADNTINAEGLPPHIVEYMLKDNLKQSYNGDFDVSDIVNWIRFGGTDNAIEAFENYRDEWDFTRWMIADLNQKSYSPTHMLRILDDSLTNIGAKNPFKQLRMDLLSAIRSFGYIRCTVELDPSKSIDTAYELCSPGITLLPLNDLYENPDDNSIAEKIPSYRDALRYYQNTEFDRQVGWSKFLQALDIMPSAFTNTTRQDFGKLD